MGLTMVLSPIFGGVIADFVGWRWAFYINLPICVGVATAALFSIDESRDNEVRGLDPLGIITFTAAMFGFTWGLINGQAHGWTTPVAVCGFILGMAAFFMFVIAEVFQHRAMLDLGLFRNPRFVGGVLAMFAYAATAQVMASMLPLYLQNGLGRSPLQAGISMFPFAISMLVFPTVSLKLSRRISARSVLVVGLSVVSLGNLLTAVGAYMETWTIVMGGMLFLGAGGGLLNGETQKAIMSAVPRGRTGMASGISTTARFSGILLGFAVLSGLVAEATRSALFKPHQTDLKFSVRFADSVIAGDLPGALSTVTASAHGRASEFAMSAYSSGFSFALFAAAGFAVLSAAIVYRLMHPGHSN